MNADSPVSRFWFGIGGLLAVAVGLAIYFWPTKPPPQPGQTTPQQVQPPPPPPEDPVSAALKRDTERLKAAFGRTRSIRVSGDIEDPWAIAVRELDVDALYDNQTGPVNYFYRDAHFLQLEALLRGMTPAQLRCVQVERQADLLKQAAEVALDLSRKLETPEAQRVLSDQLWSASHLSDSMRTDRRAFDAAYDWTSRWGSEASAIIDEQEEQEAKRLLRDSYRSAVKDALVRQGWPWDAPPSLLPAVSGSLLRDPSILPENRDRRTEAERARTQVAAIFLREIGDQRIQIARDWRALIRRLSGDRAKEFIDSFNGIWGLPKTAWQHYSDSEQSYLRERLYGYILTPSGLPAEQEKLTASLSGLPELIRARITDELDRGDDVGRTSARVQTHEVKVDSDAFRAALIKDLKQSIASAATDIGLTAVEIAVATGLFAAPEPVVTKILAVVTTLYIVVDNTWDALKARPRWARAAMVRLACTEGASSAVLGAAPHSGFEFAGSVSDAKVVLSPVSTKEQGLVLSAELKLWNWLNDKTRSW